jgi:hypothetical protein
MRDASGQMYRRNRYYDPQTGQFTQPDPIGLAGGLNAYGFADGDPVSYADPYGLCPPKFLCDLIGATAGEEATQYWAEVANNGSGIKRVAATGAGVFSALWTPDTYAETAVTLAGGGAASAGVRAGGRQVLGRQLMREVAEPSPGMIQQFSGQLSQHGRRSVERSIRRLEGRLEEHLLKLDDITARGGNRVR